MPYESGDDPQLVADVRAALRRWRRATLGETALAEGLTGVARRQAVDPRLTRAAALRQTVQDALTALRDQGRADRAQLLERRYVLEESVARLEAVYSLSERSLYYRLQEAVRSLAHVLWAMEEEEAHASPEAPPVAGPARARWRARHLPPPAHTRLYGASELLAELLAFLEAPEAPWIVCLDGMGGLGKTALALEAARRLASTDRFADIAWVTVRPPAYALDGPPLPDLPALTCGQVLDAIGQQLGDLELSALPLPAKRAQSNDLLRSTANLVVLDNLEMVMECGPLPEWLWAMADPSKFLLTSRHWLPGDGGLSVMTLHPLAAPDALALVRHEARLRGLWEVVEADDAALRPILEVTGGNPLALKLVVGQLATLPLGRVLDALRSVTPGADPFYRHLYRRTWELLPAPARELLVDLAQLPEAGGTWDELVTRSELPEAALRGALAALTAHSLLQVAGLETKTYSLHPLTRHFVAGLAPDLELPEAPPPEACA